MLLLNQSLNQAVMSPQISYSIKIHQIINAEIYLIIKIIVTYIS